MGLKKIYPQNNLAPNISDPKKFSVKKNVESKKFYIQKNLGPGKIVGQVTVLAVVFIDLGVVILVIVVTGVKQSQL